MRRDVFIAVSAAGSVIASDSDGPLGQVLRVLL